MIIQPGEKIHVVFRTTFEGEIKRHFVGTVELCEGILIRAIGYQYSEDIKLGRVVNFVKREDLRIRIIPMDSEFIILNILPPLVDLNNIQYKFDNAGTIRVTDGSDWHLDLSQL